MVGLGLQHVLAMFGSTALVPVLTGFPVSTTIFFSGIATLLFMVGASVGSAVVGGLGPVLGLAGSIQVLTALPALGLLLLLPNLRRPVSP